jgi:hypothetical protein
VLDYGDHRLEVQERDAVGNYSSSGSEYILVYPPISPDWGDTATLAKGSLTLSWADLNADSYDVYVGTDAKTLNRVGSTTKLSFTLTGLSTGRIYYWGLVARDRRGAVIYASPTYKDSTKVPFFFRT